MKLNMVTKEQKRNYAVMLYEFLKDSRALSLEDFLKENGYMPGAIQEASDLLEEVREEVQSDDWDVIADKIMRTYA